MSTNSQKLEIPLDHPVRIFLVDDQLIIRRGLSMLFRAEPDLQVCGEAGQADEAMAKIEQRQPDLAVVDLFLAAGDTLSLISELRQKLPGLIIIVFSTNRDPSYVVRAMRAGADDYVPKDEGAYRIVRTIRELFREQGAKRAMAGKDVLRCEVNLEPSACRPVAVSPAPSLLI